MATGTLGASPDRPSPTPEVPVGPRPSTSRPHEPIAPAVPLSRRSMLRHTGALGVGALVLAACGDGGTTTSDEPPAGLPASPVSGEDAADAALRAAGVDAPIVLTPIVATFEVLTGGGSRVQFGVLDESNSPILDGDFEAYLVRDDGTLAQGPVEPLFHGEGLGARGVYVFEADLEEPGLHDLLVVTADGSKAGTAAMQVRTPEQSAVAYPGAEFPAVATPTTDDPQGLEELCTRATNCGMHEVSLDDAMAEGRPVVLTIATPKYCQTAVCGPVVDVVLEQRDQLDRDDITFIHAEVYVDAGNTPTDVVTELGLPSEPWTFLIAADGTLADRFDGPVVPQLLRESIEANL